LKAYLAGKDLQETAYWREYLRPTRSKLHAKRRLNAFLELYEDVRANGIKAPVCVAQVGHILEFPYFRFNGAHRTACAEVLGLNLPAMIFETYMPATAPSKKLGATGYRQ
jgi:hypothetical protein